MPKGYLAAVRHTIQWQKKKTNNDGKNTTQKIIKA
jgi:hypothetical protein